MTLRTTPLRPRFWLSAVLALVILASGCASGGSRTKGGGDLNKISGAELIAARSQGISNLEELINRIRPRWLQTDRIQSFYTESGILVYDGTDRVGGPEVLANYTIDLIKEVRWLNSAQAGTLPGAGSMHVEGAIMIIR